MGALWKAVFFLILGLSNPKIGTNLEEVKRDGIEISRKYINRQVFVPGADVSNAPDIVKDIAEVEHTDAVKKTYADFLEAAEAKRTGG